jgi:hypothetical protein
MISRALEELVPIIFLYTRDRRLKKRETDPTILNNPSFVGYGGLTVEQADERLKEERTRAAALDEKTFKLTLSLAIGLTVVGTAITALIEKVPGPVSRLAIATGLAIAITYILLGGVLALGAMRTLPAYGYGTAFLIQKTAAGSVTPLIESLARQETSNNRRHLRNEAALQMLRNGFLVLLAAFIGFAASYGSRLVSDAAGTEPPPVMAETPWTTFGWKAATQAPPQVLMGE